MSLDMRLTLLPGLQSCVGARDRAFCVRGKKIICRLGQRHNDPDAISRERRKSHFVGRTRIRG